MSTSEMQRVKVHINPELEYYYRDIANVHVGMGDVVLEFGNHHRSAPEHGTIQNRIVLTTAKAMALHKALGEALEKSQKQLQEAMRQQQQQNQ